MKVVAAVRRAGAASLRRADALPGAGRSRPGSSPARCCSALLVLGSARHLPVPPGRRGAWSSERRVVAVVPRRCSSTKRAQLQFNSTDLVDSQERLTTAARGIVQEQARHRTLALRRARPGWTPTSARSTVAGRRSSGEVGLADVPDRAAGAGRARTPRTQHEQIAPIKLSGQADPVASWVIGQQVELPRARHVRLYFVFPMERERDSLALVGRTFLLGGLRPHGAHRRHRLRRHPAGRHAGPDGRRRGRAAGGRAAGRADGRARRGRPGHASATSFNEMADGLQRQIRQLEELSRLAAAVRLRRLPRAAHAADDGPDGGRRPPRRTRRVPAGRRPVRRAAARRARPVRGAAVGPAGDQPVRRRRGRARRRAHATCVDRWPPGRRRHAGRWPTGAAAG